MKKRVFCLILAVIMLMSCNVFRTKVQASNFLDLADTHWAINYIDAMQQINIINGYEDGTFKPENEVKTGEFLKMAAMAKWPKYQYKVPAEGKHWAYQYAELLDIGTLNKYEYDNERLESVITRGEAAEIIGSVYRRMNPEVNIDYSDKYIKQYADEATIYDGYLRDSISICTQFGIINGFEDGTFRPDETLTRAQAAKLLYTAIYN